MLTCRTGLSSQSHRRCGPFRSQIPRQRLQTGIRKLEAEVPGNTVQQCRGFRVDFPAAEERSDLGRSDTEQSGAPLELLSRFCCRIPVRGAREL